ncbi:MAG: DUF3253 domain-containing protein [Rhodospirillales bacterium]|nr:DUF3253 domain-containing protein [Rhodospirillales bacterium]
MVLSCSEATVDISDRVAQALAPENWRGLLTLVRQAAAALAAEGQIDILRKGKPVAPEDMRGVIRLAIRQKEPE